jgi:hypothetical protein
MITVNYPKPDFRIKQEDNVDYIFDEVRKKWLVLQPEEWVRQNIIAFFYKVCEYPLSHIAIEKQILVGTLLKRFDVLVYDSLQQPWLLVECKAPSVNLNSQSISQLLAYESVVAAPFFLVTNGESNILFKKTTELFEIIQNWPKWE